MSELRSSASFSFPSKLAVPALVLAAASNGREMAGLLSFFLSSLRHHSYNCAAELCVCVLCLGLSMSCDGDLE